MYKLNKKLIVSEVSSVKMDITQVNGKSITSLVCYSGGDTIKVNIDPNIASSLLLKVFESGTLDLSGFESNYGDVPGITCRRR